MSGPPSLASNERICWESEGWATPSRRAALVNDPSSTTAKKALSWRKFIEKAYGFYRTKPS